MKQFEIPERTATTILKSAFDLAMIIPLSAVGITLEFWKGVRKVINSILTN